MQYTKSIKPQPLPVHTKKEDTRVMLLPGLDVSSHPKIKSKSI